MAVDAKAIENLSPLAVDLRSESADRYLATLFAPAARRPALFALYAFDNEIARVQGLVREPMAGLIRLQWWEDVIDGFDRGKTAAHPVVKELERATGEQGLETGYLKRAIDGRRRPFEDDAPPDPEAFERYLLGIGGSITSAAAALLGARDQATLALADRVGLIHAILEQLRFVETAKSGRKAWLPSTWLEAEGAPLEQRPTATARSQSFASRHLAAWGQVELAALRRQRTAIARSQLAAFFPGTLSGLRLKDASRALQRPHLPMAVPTLTWCWLRGRF